MKTTKKKAPPRDQLNIRLSPGDLEKLRRAADRERRTLSDWARLALLDAAKVTK
jgi:uncharacterized protein (DUF1778 family)